MKKLVLIYYISDNCTYSDEQICPFYYESVEKAEYDLLTLWEEKVKIPHEQDEYPNSEVNFAGIDIDLQNLGWGERDKKQNRLKLSYSEPKILELDEWFDRYAQPLIA